MKVDYRKTKHGVRRFSNPIVYRATVHIQNLLYSLGVKWHNTYSDECVKDFSCCNKN